jgi:hypothetical protein
MSVCALDPEWPVPEAPATPMFQGLLEEIKDAKFARYVQGLATRTDHAISLAWQRHLEAQRIHVLSQELSRRSSNTVITLRFTGAKPKHAAEEPAQGSDAITAAVDQFVDDSGEMEFPKDWFRPETRFQRFRRRMHNLFSKDKIVYADITDVQKKVSESVS